KNAHDAYADHVEAHFYRTARRFVLIDDGVGMSERDFLERWLTLGTDSKLQTAHGLEPPPIDPTKPRRPIMGEKGIGRLAIAALGPQVLVLSRRRTKTGDAEMIAAFVNWRIFECPGLDLGEVEVPI